MYGTFYLLKYNEYPWNENTKKIFLDYVSHNNVIKTEPYFSLKKNQSIYPESVILKKLGFNTKEGNFILNGILKKVLVHLKVHACL